MEYSNKISRLSKEGRAWSKLEPVNVCADYIEAVKARLISQMEQAIDSSRDNVLEWGCSYWGDGFMDDMGIVEANVGYPAPSQSDSATAYSETNTQEKGVDEADYIKNDGATIYILADGVFKIIDAWPPETAAVLSETAIEGTPKRLYVYQNRAVVYSSIEHVNETGEYYGNEYYMDNDECTYGYNCDFTGDGNDLKITVLDIADRSHPVLKREVVFSGSYINSRRIGTAVHTVIFFPEIHIDGIVYWPEILENCWQEPNGFSDETIIAAFDLLKIQNRKIIEAADLSAFYPWVQDTVYGDGVPETNGDIFSDCAHLYISNQDEAATGLLSVVSMDMDREQALNQTSVLGGPGAIYATNGSLYVTNRQNRYNGNLYLFEDTSLTEATIIHKFSLNREPAASAYSSSGMVKGRVLNQFSMSEADDVFRIATTTGHVGGNSAHNTLSLLHEAADGLEILGQIDNIAPSEDIRSVRFDGEKAYMVTFKKTDPLYVFDLSNPSAPTIESALKIPGFSTYMHLMDDTHLLTIGYDAQDEGRMAWFQGILLQIFDVADMKNPSLIHREVIGTRGSSSEAATNHLAFNYFEPNHLFALPITVCEGSTGGSNYGYDLGFSGLYVFDIDVAKGFTFLGGVSHLTPGSESLGALCGNWWTKSNSQVKRSIFMDDYVYSVSTTEIIISGLDDIETEVKKIALK